MEKEIKNTEFEVSGDLADKLAELFQAVLSSDPLPSSGNHEEDKVYYFTTGDYSREFRESEISDRTNYHELVRICQDIARDLQQGNLNEPGYIDQINGILENIRLHTFLG